MQCTNTLRVGTGQLNSRNAQPHKLVYKASCPMSDAARCVCSVYNKMCDMSDVGMKLGGRGGLVSKWVCKKLMPPHQRKKMIKGLGKMKPQWVPKGPHGSP